MEEDADESREERRSPIILKVVYKRLNTFFYDYTKNISKGGTFIKTDRPLEVGTMFRFHLTVPVSSEPIELRGEVRWVVRPGERDAADLPVADEEAGMGIRFVYAEPEERALLERTVEQMMVKSLGQAAYARLFAHHANADGDAPPPGQRRLPRGG
ncbi:MAG: TIGR02266 family protein [Polyangia bacterium]